MSIDENSETLHPFGFWITATDRLLRAEFATVFEDEGITRRDWRIMNVVDGTAASDHPLRGRKLHRLIELGWVERTADGWSLTETGRLAKEHLSAAVQEIRDRIAGAVTPEEFATMSAALEKIARELGWEEGRKLPRRRGFHGRHGRRGFGARGRTHGFRDHRQNEHHDDQYHEHQQHEHHQGRGHRGFGRHGFVPAPHIHIHKHG